ncbi:Transmembrane osmosensor [Coemansia aciculifera]|uniref:Transmembrane osmosensor n=2 Tax=Coemansia TaxID=4863 RepID=A0A9W8GU79_9FUNG|nr:Transmembrane osmosensor [Coemansia pectinata]KAJ2862037.1 Transmembrane osmosensor [Coemansia aciculifera]KAJ2871883.1 Transmembrane osmosensor [Coemansia aciculifera]
MPTNFKRVVSNPIFGGTLVLMFAGLIVSLACAATQPVYIAATTWFMIVYLLKLAVALVWAVASGALHRYRLALLTMIGVGLSLNVGHIGYYINASIGALQAMSAGLIFAEITLFFWVLVLGSGPGTYLAELTGTGSEMRSMGYGGSGGEHSMSRVSNYRHTVNSNTNSGGGGSIADYYTSELNQSTVSGKGAETTSIVYKARALYPYDANPDDPNEVSITKEEIMLVIDDSGKWWQVKKEDGSVGIAPSNYLARISS